MTRGLSFFLFSRGGQNVPLEKEKGREGEGKELVGGGRRLVYLNHI